MGFSVDFTDNKSISAEDLNAIVAEVGDGSVSVSSQFVDGSLFYTDKLNDIRNEIVTGGVASGCEAVMTETGVVIGEGICFFDSGMRMKIDSEGINLVVSENEENFVYLYASPVSDVATAVVTTEEKEGNEYVPICRIDADGNIYDARVWCRAKIPMMNSRFTQTENFTLVGGNEGKTTLLKSIPLINKAYSYIVLISDQALVMHSRDQGKYTYVVADSNFSSERKDNEDYFRVGYYHATYNPYNARFTIAEEGGCLNLYAYGAQTSKDVEMLVI